MAIYNIEGEGETNFGFEQEKIQRFTIHKIKEKMEYSSQMPFQLSGPENNCRVQENLKQMDDHESNFRKKQKRSVILKQAERRCLKGIRESFLVSKNKKLFAKLMKSQVGGYEAERERHLKSFPETIHPFSDFRWNWDIFMTLILILTLIFQPVQIAFYSQSLSQLDSALLNSVACIIFFIDIVLNFWTGYVGSESDEVILDSKLTTKNYLKTWFLIDFLSTIPFDLIYIAVADLIPSGDVYFKFFRLLELLKVLRLARVVKYLTKMQQANDIRPHYIRLINLVTLMLLILHWLACMHYLVADLVHGTNPEIEKRRHSWVTEMELWNHPVWEKYINSVLRALSNMGCLGYGYVSPRAPEDVCCTIVSIMIGATWFALFIANVSNIVLNLDASHKRYDETLGHIMDYMKFKHMPKELQGRVETYFEQKYRHNLFNEDEILTNLSSVLRAQLQMFNCQHLVRQVPIFQGVRNEILQEIVASLKAEVYLPRDVILWENTVGDSMYFIQRGAVEVLTTSGKVISQLHEGNFFGEMALLTNERRRVATVVASTRCELYSLHKPDFEKIVEMYPEVFKEILSVAKERARKITLEQSESIVSGDETIRKREERPVRQSIQYAFATFSEKNNDENKEGLEEILFRQETPLNEDEVRRERKKGMRPLRNSLEEIINMKFERNSNSSSALDKMGSTSGENNEQLRVRRILESDDEERSLRFSLQEIKNSDN